MPSKQCAPRNRELEPSPEQVAEQLRSRRSIRAYQNREVDHATIEQIFELVRYAPSAHNAQETAWVILSNRETVHQLGSMTIDYMRNLQERKPAMGEAIKAGKLIATWESGVDRICRGAPHVVVAHGPKNSRWGAIDAAVALSNLDFAAQSFGLGTCWLGYVMAAEARWEPIKKLFDLPEDRSVYGVVALGYPAYEYQRIPARKPALITWR
jgi:nitroreductase